MSKSEASAHVFEPQTLGGSISSISISVCKVLIFLNYFFSPFDHWIVGVRSWRPILDLVPKKFDPPKWTHFSCLMVWVLAPSVLFSVATLLRVPRRESLWSSYFIQAAVIIPTFVALIIVISIMQRSGAPVTTEGMDSITEHDGPSNSQLETPVALFTTLMLQLILAGFTNAALQQLSSSPTPSTSPSSPSHHTWLLQIQLRPQIIGVIGPAAKFTRPSVPASLDTRDSVDLIYRIRQQGTDKSYIAHSMGAGIYLDTPLPNFDVELRDPRIGFPNLPPNRGYRISGDYALFSFVCLIELVIGFVSKSLLLWLWMPLQQLKETGVWFRDLADKAGIVLDITRAMFQAARQGDWAAAKDVASAAYQDHIRGVSFVGFNIITIAFAVFIGYCFDWFNGYLARISAQL
ncbi:hypothetical protein D6C85_10175 [Aureobasidium pullulans]|uniref:Uncharacterized protein n=2 Tax=Aureobasidium pullulans TaxID=5580 RepID=A0A4S9W1H8_AURPU|nr:hypothetical protein D6C85_10175 [Aureobasidium pullulans]